MRNIYLAILCPLLVVMASCSKDNTPAPLAAGSIGIDYLAEKDTLEMPLSILKDSTIVLPLKAALSGATSGKDHYVKFVVDTTKLKEYKSRFGNALLLPADNYLFYKSSTRISAGTNVSEPALLNLGQQSKLTEYSTYVLPVKIQSVDGLSEGQATDRVLYLVFKTGKPMFISKTGWTIADFSSQNSTLAPANILDDNNLTTYWVSNVTQPMPQWVTINFNRDVTFTALTYYFPTAMKYPTMGGYPTSIKIETSLNGTTWENKGLFTGNIVDNMQTLSIGETKARYLRFTAMAVVKYATYDAVFISGISLIP